MTYHLLGNFLSFQVISNLFRSNNFIPLKNEHKKPKLQLSNLALKYVILPSANKQCPTVSLSKKHKNVILETLKGHLYIFFDKNILTY